MIPDSSSFDRIWLTYFEKMYGPNWRTSRQGRRDACAYCSGKISTQASRKMTAEVVAVGGNANMKSSCER